MHPGNRGVVFIQTVRLACQVIRSICHSKNFYGVVEHIIDIIKDALKTFIWED